MTVITTNDTTTLVPRTAFVGPSLRFDLPGLLVGVAEYAEGPTGCTVFLFPGGAQLAIDQRGGAVGLSGAYPVVNAICLAGGSLLGLEAASGVAAELWAQRGYGRGWSDIPAVAGAIINDFGRTTSIYPDKALGRAAARAAQDGVFPLGARGVGVSATCGKFYAVGEPSGQGAAFLAVGAVRVAVFTVVNAVGAVVGRDGAVVRGNRDARTGERRSAVEQAGRQIQRDEAGPLPAGNTTLTVLVTNLRLNSFTLRQLGREVHSAMSRAIQPFHTATDGDVFFTASTGGVDDEARLASGSLGVLAAELAWDAVLASIPADPTP